MDIRILVVSHFQSTLTDLALVKNVQVPKMPRRRISRDGLPLLSMLLNICHENYDRAKHRGLDVARYDAVAEPLCEWQPSFHRK